MQTSCKLSNVAKNYLNTFHCTLDGMIQDMTEAELNNSISYNFIAQMVPHHQAAIEMSQNLLQYTTSSPYRTLPAALLQSRQKALKPCRKFNALAGCVKTAARICAYTSVG